MSAEREEWDLSVRSAQMRLDRNGFVAPDRRRAIALALSSRAAKLRGHRRSRNLYRHLRSPGMTDGRD